MRYLIFLLSAGIAHAGLNLDGYDRLSPANLNVAAHTESSQLQIQLSPISKLSSDVIVQVYSSSMKKISSQRCWGMKDNVFTFDNFGLEGRGWIVLVVKNGQIIGFQASPSALEKKIPMSTH
ncbi:hypothetical protein BH09VER1_BH09VER1_25960 [soil metagenome]